MAQQQTGGRELGRGVTARTIEISNSSDATDTDTFKHILVSALADVKKTKSRRAWILYVLEKKKNGMTRVKLTTSGEKEQFCSNVLNTKVSDKFVCKDLNSATAFYEEIRTAELLFRNVSASGLAKATTFSSIPFKHFNVVGLDLGGKAILSRDSGFYVFSLRCSMSAASKGISSDADMDKFVRETLENFDVIHRAGVIHGDVKLDNMIYCAKDDRYRLIDWGKTADHAEMLARYVDNTRFGFVNNTSSPMAWFCSGMNYAASLVFMTMIVTRHMERVAMCPPMRALVAHAYTSFNLAVRSILGGNPLFKLDKVTDKKLRLDLLDRYAQSFDLYDIGLILTAFVCIYDDALSVRMRERALALAFRLVDYGDPSAHLSTARDALRWWVQESKRTSSTNTKSGRSRSKR
jgi:serine/threonine protein kinase